MLSVTLVLAVLIGIMNIVNFRSVLAQTDERLEILAENGGSFPALKPDSFGDIEPGKDMKPVLHRRNLEMPFDTRYFTVTLDSDGNIRATDTDHIAAVSSDLAGQMVEDVRLAVNGAVPVKHFGRLGGIVPEPEEIVNELKSL